MSQSFLKNRAVSAKKATGANKKSSKNGQRIDRVYTDHSEMFPRQSFSKLYVTNLRNSESNAGSKAIFSKIHKEPEQILQQNLNLKKFINELQNQLTLQKSKVESQKKKTNTYNRQLTRQFQKQLYYSGKNPNSHLITGVKHQYETMKILYEEKCVQNDQMRKTIEYSNIEQLKIYNETLQMQNKILTQKLNIYMQCQRDYADEQISALNKRPPAVRRQYRSFKPKKDNLKVATEYLEEDLNIGRTYDKSKIAGALLAQERIKNVRATEIIEGYSSKIRYIQQILKEKERKIQFLESIIIEKDNNENASKQKAKQIQKQKHQLVYKIGNLEKQLSALKQRFIIQTESLKQRQSRKFQLQKQIFDKSLQQKSIRIQKLEKQIRFMSTLLSYWKPLDEINKDLQKYKENDEQIQKSQKELSMKEPSESFIFKVNEPSHDQGLGIQSNPTIEYDIDHNKSYSKAQVKEQQARKSIKSQSFGVLSKAQSYQNKTPQTSNFKYSENAIKCRKVDINEISFLGELLKYRFIGAHLSIQDVKSLFSYKGNQTDQSKIRYLSEYISMKEVKSILKEAPFSLTDSASHLLSRYIVEDSQNEHVYCDQGNEIKRTIAKSIIKAFVGEFEVISESEIKSQEEAIFKQYGSNMKLALKSIAPKGIITLKQFNELILGLGIEMSFHLHEWLIGKMVKTSLSLQDLLYDVIFQ